MTRAVDRRDDDAAATAIQFLYRRVPGGKVVLEWADRIALAYLERRYAAIGRAHGWRYGIEPDSTRTN